MTSRLKWMFGGAAALALVAPGAAQAATKSVSMGTPPAIAKTLQQMYGSDANAFFPSSIAIRVGDSVRFLPTGFHNVHFLGRSGKATTPFVPTGKTIADANDEAGAPFWFNGQMEVGTNPKVFGPGKPRQDRRDERNQGDPERRASSRTSPSRWSCGSRRPGCSATSVTSILG